MILRLGALTSTFVLEASWSIFDWSLCGSFPKIRSHRRYEEISFTREMVVIYEIKKWEIF